MLRSEKNVAHVFCQSRDEWERCEWADGDKLGPCVTWIFVTSWRLGSIVDPQSNEVAARETNAFQNLPPISSNFWGKNPHSFKSLYLYIPQALSWCRKWNKKYWFSNYAIEVASKKNKLNEWILIQMVEWSFGSRIVWITISRAVITVSIAHTILKLF